MTSLKDHEIVSKEEWVEARKELLKKEKEFTTLRDQLSQQRRDLPWVAVNKEYVFEGQNEKQTLSELFDGRSQLLVYHFMFDPNWKAGCPNCSFWADNFNGIIVHLNQRDVTMIAVSRTPYSKLAAYQKRMGWDFKWVSSYDTDFNFDYHVSFTQEELAIRKHSTTILHKPCFQRGKESAYFSKTLQVACFTPIQLMHVASIC